MQERNTYIVRGGSGREVASFPRLTDAKEYATLHPAFYVSSEGERCFLCGGEGIIAGTRKADGSIEQCKGCSGTGWIHGRY